MFFGAGFGTKLCRAVDLQELSFAPLSKPVFIMTLGMILYDPLADPSPTFK